MMTTEDVEGVMSRLVYSQWHDVYRDGLSVNILYSRWGIHAKQMSIMCQTEVLAEELEAILVSEELQLCIVSDWFADNQDTVTLVEQPR